MFPEDVHKCDNSKELLVLFGRIKEQQRIGCQRRREADWIYIDKTMEVYIHFYNLGALQRNYV